MPTLPRMRILCDRCSAPFAPVYHGYSEPCPKAVAAVAVGVGAGETPGAPDDGTEASDGNDLTGAVSDGVNGVPSRGSGGDTGTGESEHDDDAPAGEDAPAGPDYTQQGPYTGHSMSDCACGGRADWHTDGEDRSTCDVPGCDCGGYSTSPGSWSDNEKSEGRSGEAHEHTPTGVKAPGAQGGTQGQGTGQGGTSGSDAGSGDGQGGQGEQGDQSDGQQGEPAEGDGQGQFQAPPDPNLEDLIRRIAGEVAGGLDAELEKSIAELIANASAEIRAQREVDMAKLFAEIETRAEIQAQSGPRTVHIVTNYGVNATVAGEHYRMPVLARLVAARLNTYLVGPAGSGKTTAGERVSAMLGLGFFPKSMGEATMESDLLGYMDAGGNYVPGPLFKPFTEGGLIFLDEMDAASASAVTVLNAALANGYCSFPHGVFPKHADCTFAVGANTFGRGADRMYVGRTQLDAATLNRFFTVDWEYDAEIEAAISASISGVNTYKVPGRSTDDLDIILDEVDRPAEAAVWVEYVHRVRKAIEANGIRAIAGTRDIVDGTHAIMRAGFTCNAVAKMRMFAGMNADDLGRIMAELNA